MLPCQVIIRPSARRYSKTIKLTLRYWAPTLSMESLDKYLATLWKLTWYFNNCCFKRKSRRDLKWGFEIIEQNPNKTKIKRAILDDEVESKQARRNLLLNEQKNLITKRLMHETTPLENAPHKTAYPSDPKLSNLRHDVESWSQS